MENDDLNSKPVYSTEGGSLCPECGQALGGCLCSDIKKAALPAGDGVARLSYEIKGKGKGVTVIRGLALSENGLLDLAKKLKQRFGAGGSVKDRAIQLQGDFRQQARAELLVLGYPVR